MNITLPTLDPLTIIEGKPTYSTLTIATAQLRANARKIPARSDDNGHDFLCMTDDELLERFPDPDAPFDRPARPEELGLQVAGLTQNQLTERNRIHKEKSDDFKLMLVADTALKACLLAALDEDYYSVLRNRRSIYANLTTLQILTHLTTAYGRVSNQERKDNVLRLLTPWDPNDPIERIWSRITDINDFAEDAGTPIPPEQQIHDTLLVLNNSGVFAADLAAYDRDVDEVDRTMENLQSRFNKANDKRLEHRTAGQAGYQDHANIAQTTELTRLRRQLQQAMAAIRDVTPAPTRVTPATPTTPAPAITPTPAAAPTASPRARHYCHTHGFGLNYRHTSATCQNPGPNHVSTATADNTMGGTLTEMSPRNPANPRS
ncbi:hypothetical protein MPSEU_000716000 [Mayamaea pseudoterrestris]|nr:hypothetical protein MPSEU_000716000 [Mayamaea pseudoterrestris]